MTTGMRPSVRGMLALGGALLLFVVVGVWHALPAAAATITVNVTDDTVIAGDGGVTLREAVAAINAGTTVDPDITGQTPGAFGSNDTILFSSSVSGTIPLTQANGPLTLMKSVTIVGPTSGTGVVVDGGCTFTTSCQSGTGTGVFHVNPSVTAKISNLTIQHGNAPAGSCGGVTCGGGIFNFGALTVTNSTLFQNSATLGGGIENQTGGVLTVTNSTLSANAATGSGGGIDNSSGTVTVTNSTLSGNSASSFGGGINNPSGTVMVTNSTLSANAATGSGGGIETSSAPVTLRNTLVAANTGSNPDVHGFVASTSTYNLIGNGSGMFGISNNDANGNQVGTSGSPILPLLGALADNGGPTQTMELMASSPAIDAGDDATCALTGAGQVNSLDQRGIFRFVGAHCDIGAYERVASAVACVVTSALDPIDGTHLTLREAVGLANLGQCTSSNTITFASGTFPSGTPTTITLDAPSGTLTLSYTGGPTTINGTGNQVVVDGGCTGCDPGNTPIGGVQVFNVSSGVTANLTALTIQHGHATGSSGGGILTRGTLTLTNSTVANNANPGRDGGISTGDDFLTGIGTLTMTNGTVSGNNGNGIGGVGLVTVANSTIANNIGSGISSATGVTVTNSIVSGNHSTSFAGGVGGGSVVTVINSTITGNTTTQDGGGIVTLFTATITNSTITGNSASGKGGGFANGGNNIVPATITNSTITGNTAATGGGFAQTFTNVAVVKNSIVSGNTGGDTAGTFTNGGHNLIGASPAPLLDPHGLQANGGTGPKTIALLPGSPAIDAGDPTTCANLKDANNTPLTTDERGTGFARTVGAVCDIGAFESQGFTLAITGGNPQSAFVTLPFTNPLAVSVTSSHNEPVDGAVVTFTVTPAGTGASATLAAGTATVASGAASVTATANGTAGGPYTVTASATGVATAAIFSLTNLAPIALSPATLPDGAVGVAYSQQLSATGGTGPFTFTKSGTLPGGITLDSTGLLHGTPTQQGAFPLTVTATDANSATGMQTYTLTIGTAALQSISLTCGVNPATVPIGGSVTCIATGTFSDHTTQPVTNGITYTSSDPTIATVDPTTGKITGKAAGTVTITVTVGGVTQQIVVTVHPPGVTGIIPPARGASGAGSPGASAPPAPTGRTSTAPASEPVSPAPSGR